MSSDQTKGKKDGKPGKFIVDKKDKSNLAKRLEECIGDIAGEDVDKIVVLTIDKEGDVRPIFVDPKGNSAKTAEKCSDVGLMLNQPAPLMEIPEGKEIIKQRVMSLTAYRPNPDLFCWINCMGHWECIWI